MEVNINERRQSAAVPPPWLEPKPQPYNNVFVGALSPQEGPSRNLSLVPGGSAAAATKAFEEGYHTKQPVTSSKAPIQDRHDGNLKALICFFFFLFQSSFSAKIDIATFNGDSSSVKQ